MKRVLITGADGFIPASTIGLDYYRYDEGSHALIGDKTGETFQLGDRVDVRLVEAAPFAGALRFELASEGRKPGRLSRKPHKGKSGGKPGGKPGGKSASKSGAAAGDRKPTRSSKRAAKSKGGRNR